MNLVDPSATIRPEFVSQSVVTKDGRVLTGLVVEETAESFTLADSKAQRTTIAREAIDSLEPSPTSLMPEKIIEPLPAQDLRDLFSYLESAGPKEN